MAERKLERRAALDPAVADLLSGMQQRQTESQLPRKERERLTKERAKIQSRRDLRATYDLPPNLRESIRVLAEELRLPASQLVTLALARFMNEYNNGQIDLGKYKQPSRSPRYDWNLIFPEDLIHVKKKK
ncbi:MAG: Uncharacterized protein FD147_2457 [Chloroflexi bacterium]|nr:MAG: Uncharacterized protein FD147_2457 [Chloroflexota bacterium]MBA4376351.1 hypothetical protein [Anaerolinea sp.]